MIGACPEALTNESRKCLNVSAATSRRTARSFICTNDGEQFRLSQFNRSSLSIVLLAIDLRAAVTARVT
jgi:hypothetical protein